MLARVHSRAVIGVECVPVRVEVHVTPGIPSISVVGLPQGAVREGRDRVRAALENADFGLPAQRVTVNLAPADLKKEGSGFDLPLALGLVVCGGGMSAEALEATAFVGELGLSGEVRPVRGALAMARGCVKEGLRSLVVPLANGKEAAAADPDLEVLGASHLRQVVEHFEGGERLPRMRAPACGTFPAGAEPVEDLADVRGHETVKRALEVAAAGGHNLLMMGPPGSGKTMLARRLPGILPPLQREEALQVTAIHSVAGLLSRGMGLIRHRPFRAPHHTVSRAGLAGGGTPVQPGEMSLAHKGVLFLDELPEFPRGVLETLRQPMEAGWISLIRARQRFLFPARFTLVAAMNPCPCGHLGDPSRPCTCDPGQVRRYLGRVSGPLRDRIDLHLEVTPVPFRELHGKALGECSVSIRERVIQARRRQRARAGPEGLNASMGTADLQRHASPDEEGRRLLETAADRMGLSARAIHRVLKVARTVADLEGEESVRRHHIAEAVQYRLLDRRGAVLVPEG